MAKDGDRGRFRPLRKSEVPYSCVPIPSSDAGTACPDCGSIPGKVGPMMPIGDKETGFNGNLVCLECGQRFWLRENLELHWRSFRHGPVAVAADAMKRFKDGLEGKPTADRRIDE